MRISDDARLPTLDVTRGLIDTSVPRARRTLEGLALFCRSVGISDLVAAEGTAEATPLGL